MFQQKAFKSLKRNEKNELPIFEKRFLRNSRCLDRHYNLDSEFTKLRVIKGMEPGLAAVGTPDGVVVSDRHPRNPSLFRHYNLIDIVEKTLRLPPAPFLRGTAQ